MKLVALKRRLGKKIFPKRQLEERLKHLRSQKLELPEFYKRFGKIRARYFAERALIRNKVQDYAKRKAVFKAVDQWSKAMYSSPSLPSKEAQNRAWDNLRLDIESSLGKEVSQKFLFTLFKLWSEK